MPQFKVKTCFGIRALDNLKCFFDGDIPGKTKIIRISDNSKTTTPNGLHAIGNALDKLFAWVEVHGLAKKNPLLIAGFLVILSIVSALPSYSHFQFGGGSPLLRSAMEWKFHNPLLPIPAKQIAFQVHDESETGGISHVEKMSYRLLVPLIGYTFGFGTMTALVIQQVLACLFLLIVLLTLRRVFEDKLSALLAGMMVATSFPGQWGFSDFVFFDGVAYFFIALAFWTTSPWMVAGAVLAGGLTDERVILMTPLIWLWNGFRNGCGTEGFSVRSLLWPRANHFGIFAGVILFGLVRLYLALKWGSLYEASEVCEWIIIKKCIHFLPIATLTGFKGGIIVFFVSTALLIVRRRFALLALAGCAVMPSLMAAIMVWDLSRSLYYAFPSLFLGMTVLARQCSISECRKIMFCSFLGSILFSTCYIQPFNIRLLNY